MTRANLHAAARRLNRRQVLKYGGGAAGSVALGAFASGIDLAPLRAGKVNWNSAAAIAPGNQHFQRVWARTDYPVAQGQVSRTWMWGPEAFTPVMFEPYAESPGAERAVQYFDKARMEITNPGGDQNSIWYVTNGLLVVELITGKMQLGHNEFGDGMPAQVNVAGDPDDPDGPTYATFAGLLDAAPLALGSTIIQRVDRAGNVTSDGALAAHGVSVGFIDNVTNHSIAAPFWAFMNSSGLVYEGGQFVQAPLFEDAYFASGRPICEPYWAEVLVAGTLRLVLVQCFERRVLTYTPGNPEGWLVEAGNVGQHYYKWRYGSLDVPDDDDDHDDHHDDDDHDDDDDMPVPTPGACLMPVSDAKPKRELLERLAPYVASNQVPSAFAAAALQMMRRYVNGHQPGNDLEADVFPMLANLPADLQALLVCSLDTLDLLPENDRNTLFSSEVLGKGDMPLDVNWLAEEVAHELLQRASLVRYGSIHCAEHEEPGKVRFDHTANYSGEFPPALIKLMRINGLRLSSYEPMLAGSDFLPEELQQNCTPMVVDGQTQVSCTFPTSDCAGHMYDGVCLKVHPVIAGDSVLVEGVNFYDVDAKVVIYSKATNEIVREVPAHVCGDQETPLTETIDGSEQFISDSRVKDILTFKVPDDLPAGVYYFMVLVPNSLNVQGYGDYLFSHVQYIEVQPSPDSTFQIVAEQLHAVKETSPASLGSDEVGLRFITIPINTDLTPRESIEQKFPIFGDVDSGETRELNRVLFQGSGIAGLSMAMLGFEVDSESAYEKQITDFADAFVDVLESNWNKLATAIGGAGSAAIVAALGIGTAWATAIGAMIALGVNALIALWAPADRIIEDVVSFSLFDLAAMTIGTYPMPLGASYTSAGGIDVTVVPVSKTAEYHERREYRSSEEDSNYHITLRYSRLTS